MNNKGLISHLVETANPAPFGDVEQSNGFQIRESGMKIKLLPRPTDDPSDPLVGSCSSSSTNSITESVLSELDDI
jgi:hypothetical protein